MFPSSSGLNPFQYSFDNDQNPSLHYPDALLDDSNDTNNHYNLLSEYFLSQQQQQEEMSARNSLAADNREIHEEIRPADADKETRIKNNKKKRSYVNPAKQQEGGTTPRRRTRKKDRHSKIYTAQGPRDRRMRLSLQIARKFFDLQDILGFDKASKTIDWLFTKSKAAIKELTDSLPRVRQCSSSSGGSSGVGGKSVSSTSESEVVSGIKLTPANGGKSKNLQKPAAAASNALARESRDKARARARERTREKMKSKKCSSQANPNNLEQLGSSSPLENLDSGSQELNSPVKRVGEGEEDQEEEPISTQFLQREMDSLIIDGFLGITNTHNYGVPNGTTFEGEYSGFPGNWEMNNGRVQYIYCTVPNIKSTTAGNVHEENPNNAISMVNHSNFLITSSNPQEHNSPSIFMTSLNYHAQENPNSLFINTSKTSSSHDQNPSSFLLTANSTDHHLHSHHFQEPQFSCNPNFSYKYGGLY